MSPRLPVRSLLESGARIRRRPGIRTVVVAPGVAVIVGMAIVVSSGAADELRRSAEESAVHNVEAIVRGYVDPELQESSLDLEAHRNPSIDDQLERLTLSGEIRRINVWSRDGRVVYSSAPDLRGRRFSIGPEIAAAFAGDGVANYVDGGSPSSRVTVPATQGRYLELLVPIRGPVDGNPIGVYDVYQDGRLIEERIDATRSGVFVVALVASSILVALIWLAFGGASRVLAAQNRRLQEQATTERLLLIDLQRSEERFRSLVRNASDGVVVLGEDGLIKYQSPAVERILGRRVDAGIGEPATAGIHPGDQPAVRGRLADVAVASGTEVAIEYRAQHADGSWRTLEAIAKNLLDDPAVGGVVVNFRDITERKVLEDQLRHQAFHDVLTSLANRSLFHDRLAHALARAARSGRPTAVLYLDIDDFKAVNDRFGHAAGDRLLVAVAERLQSATRAADTVARLGGDEFAIIVEDTEAAQATQAAGRILETLAPAFGLGDHEVLVRASIGIAIESGDDTDADELLRRADIAMYAAKARGGDSHVIYEAQLYDATLARMELKADLRGALERGELRVDYQPIVDIDTGVVIGAEALMRWDHPARGTIPPAEFIPLAEESGQILELGRWILATACRQTRTWQDQTGQPNLTICVNLSGRQIADPGLVRDVERALAASQLGPHSLTLEITESALVQDVEASVSVFRALKALGIRLAIDDFGTGYSSLSYLRQFPIDILKIDRSFVASLDGTRHSSALVRSIINLSSTLRLETVAEGIETSEQRQVLQGLGAQAGQGYLFARPMDPDMFRELLGREATARPPTRSRSTPSLASTSRKRRAARRTVHPEAGQR